MNEWEREQGVWEVWYKLIFKDINKGRNMTEKESNEILWSKLAEIAPPEEWLKMHKNHQELLALYKLEQYEGYEDWDEERDCLKGEILSWKAIVKEWSKLKEIAPPEKWMEMYKHYQELLEEEDEFENRGKTLNSLQIDYDIEHRALEICFETLRQVFKDNPNTKIGG